MSSFVRLSNLDAVPASLRGAYVAIGNFDGVHRGHQSVFDLLRRRAAEAGVPAILLTFEPHPRDVFAPTPFMYRLTDGNAKARLAEALDLDGIVILNFDRAFSQIEAEDFVSRFLVGALAVTGVIVGADFHFGRQRRGTPTFLAAAGAARDLPLRLSICSMRVPRSFPRRAFAPPCRKAMSPRPIGCWAITGSPKAA